MCIRDSKSDVPGLQPADHDDVADQVLHGARLFQDAVGTMQNLISDIIMISRLEADVYKRQGAVALRCGGAFTAAGPPRPGIFPFLPNPSKKPAKGPVPSVPVFRARRGFSLCRAQRAISKSRRFVKSGGFCFFCPRPAVNRGNSCSGR